MNFSVLNLFSTFDKNTRGKNFRFFGIYSNNLMINLLLEDSSNVQNESVDYGYTNKEKSLKNRSF